MKWDISDTLKYKINICRLYKRCYFLGDLLDSTGTRFLPHSLSLKKRGFHRDKSPRVQVPQTFQSIWQSAIRHIVYQSGIGRSLGNRTSNRSVEWGLDKSKSVLIQQRYNKPSYVFLKNSRKSV